MTAITNIRDRNTGATVLPQYNILNAGYTMYRQVFERIEQGQFPEYIGDFMQMHKVTRDRLQSQLRLIADLLDGLVGYEFPREKGMDGYAYLRSAMEQLRWHETFDWEAMAVYDMLASQSMLAFYFIAVSDLITESEIKAQNMGALRTIIERLGEKSTELFTRRVKSEGENGHESSPDCHRSGSHRGCCPDPPSGNGGP